MYTDRNENIAGVESLPRSLQHRANGLEFESLYRSGNFTHCSIHNIRNPIKRDLVLGIVEKLLTRFAALGDGAVIVEVPNPAIRLVRRLPHHVLRQMHSRRKHIARLHCVLPVPPYAPLHIPEH